MFEKIIIDSFNWIRTFILILANQSFIELKIHFPQILYAHHENDKYSRIMKLITALGTISKSPFFEKL